MISYAVARRTAEMGVRLALGATPAALQWFVVRGVFGILLPGILAGLAACLAIARLVRAYLFDIEPADPATLVVSTLLLAAASLAAAYVPARRASRIDPLAALRQEP